MNRSKCKIDDTGRECSKCHKYKTWDNFKKGKGPRFRISWCRECVLKWCSRSLISDPSKRRDLSRLKTDKDGRQCRRCKAYKPWSEYSIARTRVHGREVYCKACRAASRFKRSYGITSSYYQKLSDLQGGVCAICGEKETAMGSGRSIRPLSVDHDHATDAVRGLLCSKCNTAVGLMDDSVNKLSKAIEYLSRRVS